MGLELYNFHKKTELYEVVVLSDNELGYEKIPDFHVKYILGLYPDDKIGNLNQETCIKAAKLLNNQHSTEKFGVMIQNTSIYNVKK